MSEQDLPLIVAHLLGGTTGLQLQQERTEAEVRELVARALKIGVEIQRQVEVLTRPAHIRSYQSKPD
jgi:hypothetical protein